MKTLKKLLLATLLLCSSSSFANTGDGGFDDPKKAFLFYYKLADKAAMYKDKNRFFKKEHIRTLAPHVWSQKNAMQSAANILGDHYGYILVTINTNRGEHPLIVDMKYEGPFYGRAYKTRGIIKFFYTQFKFQKNSRTKATVILRAKKINGKIKWFFY